MAPTESLLLRPHLFYRGLSPQATYQTHRYCSAFDLQVVVERVNPCIRPLLAGVVGFEPTNTRVKALRLKPLGDTPLSRLFVFSKGKRFAVLNVRIKSNTFAV